MPKAKPVPVMQSPVLDGATKGKSAKVKAAAAKTKVAKVQGKGSGPKGDKKKPKGKGKVAPAPMTPPHSPAINFQEAMEKYQNSPTRKKQRVKEEKAAEADAASQDPKAIGRAMWNRFDRSLQDTGVRASRAPKAPARIRDAIMSAPHGGVRIDFFKLYYKCSNVTRSSHFSFACERTHARK